MKPLIIADMPKVTATLLRQLCRIEQLEVDFALPVNTYKAVILAQEAVESRPVVVALDSPNDAALVRLALAAHQADRWLVAVLTDDAATDALLIFVKRWNQTK